MGTAGENWKVPELPTANTRFLNPWFTQRAHGYQSMRPPSPTPSCSSMSSMFPPNLDDLSDAIPMDNDEKIPCLFCQDMVDTTNDRDPLTSKYKMVESLCFQARLSLRAKEIPQDPEDYPLCTRCENLLKTVWDSHQKITTAIAEIERKIVDVELMKPGAFQTSMESESGNNRGYTRLSEMILEGYRKKLHNSKMERELERKKLLGNRSSSNNLNLKTHSRTSDMESEEGDADDQRSSQSQCTTESLTVDVNPIDMIRDNQCGEDEESTPIPITDQSELNDTERQSRDLEEENRIFKLDVEEPQGELEDCEDSSPCGVYNERNYTLTVVDPGVSTRSSPKKRSTEQIRLQAEPTKVQRREANDIPTLPTQGPSPSSLIFQGVRIFRICGNGPDQKYLRCSRCQFTVDSTNFRVEGTLPIQTMKHHILTKHLNVRATPVRSFKNVVFKEPLPIKRQNSGKRKPPPSSAVHRKDPGPSKNTPPTTTTVNPTRRSRRTIKKVTKFTFPDPAFGEKHVVYACHLCDRTFVRNCHRVRHMAAHTNKNKMMDLSEQINSQSPPDLVKQPKASPRRQAHLKTLRDQVNDNSTSSSENANVSVGTCGEKEM